MSIGLIFTLAVAAYALVLALVYLFAAAKRSWIMAVVRIGITVASAIAAIPLTKLLAELLSDTVYGLLLPRLGSELEAFLTAVPVGAEGMRVIAALIVAPILYLLVFLLLRWVISVIMWIVEKCVPVLKKRSLRGVSMPLGALNGILIAAVTLIPLCGYMVFASHLVGTFVDTGMTDTALVQENVLEPFGLTEDDLSDLAEGLEGHPVVAGIHNTIGKPVYTTLTTGELDASETHGQAVEMNLERELSGLWVTASHAMEVVESMERESYTPADKEQLFATADSFFESEWIRLLAADALVAMSETWLENKPFAGIERPALDAALNPTVNRLLEILAAETPDTLEEDIHVILDVTGDLLVNDLLKKNADYTAMVQRMGQSGLLTDMLAKLEESDRLQALAVELKALAIRLVSNMLGVDKLQSGEYAEMMGDVAGTLTDALDMSETERDALILDTVKNNFANQGFDVPDEMVLNMSHEMIDQLGADGEITEAELTDYLVNHADEGFDIMGDVEIPDELPEGLPDMQP